MLPVVGRRNQQHGTRDGIRVSFLRYGTFFVGGYSDESQVSIWHRAGYRGARHCPLGQRIPRSRRRLLRPQVLRSEGLRPGLRSGDLCAEVLPRALLPPRSHLRAEVLRPGRLRSEGLCSGL
jgi:hypothetical protein